MSSHQVKALLAILACTAATSVLLTVSLPPVGWWPLAWVALAPLFWAVSGRGFILGFLAGIGSSMLLGWFAVEGWLYPVKSFEGASNWTYLGTAIFGFVLSLLAGVVGEKKEIGWKSVLVLPSVAVLLDLVLMPVLPVSYALSQARVSPMLGLASWTGIWGVSFALWSVNLALAKALRERSLGFLARTLSVLVGALALANLPLLIDRQTGGETLLVGVVQVPAERSADLPVVEALSLKGGAQFVVWPEFAGLAHTRDGDATPLMQLARTPKFPAFVTSFPDDFSPLPHNTAALFDVSGESVPYHKRRLFGGEKNMHTAGTRAVVADTKWGPVGLNICFDSCFPSLMRDSATLGPVALIALPTIDPQSPHGFLAAMHAAFTPFRATELGVAVARADGYAHSMIVDNRGRILAELPPQVEDTAVASVNMKPRWTLVKAVGDWFPWACGLLLLALPWIGRANAKNRALEPPAQPRPD